MIRYKATLMLAKLPTSITTSVSFLPCSACRVWRSGEPRLRTVATTLTPEASSCAQDIRYGQRKVGMISMLSRLYGHAWCSTKQSLEPHESRYGRACLTYWKPMPRLAPVTTHVSPLLVMVGLVAFRGVISEVEGGQLTDV